MAEYDQELDACGLNCPLPILRAKKSLAGMEAGQVLHVIATDSGAVKDFEAFSLALIITFRLAEIEFINLKLF